MAIDRLGLGGLSYFVKIIKENFEGKPIENDLYHND